MSRASEIQSAIAACLPPQTEADGSALIRRFPEAVTRLEVVGPFRSREFDRAYHLVQVETTVEDADLDDIDDDDGLDMANRLAMHGAFFALQDNRFRLRASASIYDGDEAADFYAWLFARVFWQQGAAAVAVLNSVRSRAQLAEWREGLSYRMDWETPPTADQYAESLKNLRDYQGLVANADKSGLIFEVPLASDSARSRSIDPLAVTALLSIRTDLRHPLFGVGYAFSIELPLQTTREVASAWAARLNIEEQRDADTVPRLGAWSGLQGIEPDMTSSGREAELRYSGFIPTAIPGVVPITMLVDWLALRTVWMRDTYWKAIQDEVVPRSDDWRGDDE